MKSFDTKLSLQFSSVKLGACFKKTEQTHGNETHSCKTTTVIILRKYQVSTKYTSEVIYKLPTSTWKWIDCKL